VIAFRPLTATDLPLVGDWFGRQHVRRWWRDREQSLRHCEDALAGRDPTRYFLIVVDEQPVGLIQTYLVADNPEWGAAIGEAGSEDQAGVDLMIGKEELTGRGLGPQILERFACEVVFADPRTRAVVATVEEPNRRSWRAFEKAGFRRVRDVEEEGLPHRLMRLDR